MKFLDVDLGAELYDVTESHSLFGVAHEESLCDEGGILIEDLRLEQSMKVSTIISRFQVASALKVIWVRIVDFLLVFIEDLKFQEVDTLLEKVNISEVLHMKHKFVPCSVHLLATISTSQLLSKYTFRFAESFAFLLLPLFGNYLD